MGTIHYVSGEITFNLPLTAVELRSDPFAPYADENVRDNFDVMLIVDTVPVETDEGTLMRRTADRIVPTWPDEGKNYEIGAELAALTNLLGARTYRGHLEVCREMSGVADFEAYQLHVRPDGSVYRIDAQVIWLDTNPHDVTPKRPEPPVRRRGILG